MRRRALPRSTTRPICSSATPRFLRAPAIEQSLAQLYPQHPDATFVAGATDVGLWVTKKLASIEKIVRSAASPNFPPFVKTDAAFSLGAIVSLERAAPVLGSIVPTWPS